MLEYTEEELMISDSNNPLIGLTRAAAFVCLAGAVATFKLLIDARQALSRGSRQASIAEHSAELEAQKERRAA